MKMITQLKKIFQMIILILETKEKKVNFKKKMKKMESLMMIIVVIGTINQNQIKYLI